MRLFKLSLAAALIAGAATPALATDADVAFNNFQKVCGSPMASYNDVVAAADSDAWTKPPGTMGGDTFPNVTVAEKTSRSRTVGAQNLVLFAYHGTLPDKAGGVFQFSNCTLSSDTGDLGQVQGKVRGWLSGVTPASSTADSAQYLFTTVNGHPQPAPGMNEAAASTGFEILKVYRQGSHVNFDLIVVKK